MSDKFQAGIRAGSVNVSIPLILRSTVDNTELTGKIYTDITASYWRQGGIRTAITPASLAGSNSAWSAGGFKEVDSVNMPGTYRFDIPDAAFAAGAEWVVIQLVVSGAYTFVVQYNLPTKGNIRFKVAAGTITTTSFPTDLTQVNDNDVHFPALIKVLSGGLNAEGQLCKLALTNAYNGMTKTVTLDSSTPLTAAPNVGDEFELVLN